MSSSSKLKKLVREYLRASYWGLRDSYLPNDLSKDCLANLIKAEEDLWEAVSGKRDLFDAMRALGYPMAKVDGGTLGRDGRTPRYKPRPVPAKRPTLAPAPRRALPRVRL